VIYLKHYPEICQPTGQHSGCYGAFMAISILQIRDQRIGPDHFLIVMHPMSKEMVAGAAGEGERKYQIT
jgi:hypothetical protein